VSTGSHSNVADFADAFPTSPKFPGAVKGAETSMSEYKQGFKENKFK
jgi:hypothetical protein